jgi:acyl carrier protein
MNSSIRQEIYELAASVLEVPLATIHPDTRFEDYQMDSLAMVEFIFAVQERYGVDFETAEFDKLKTLGDLIGAVESKLH